MMTSQVSEVDRYWMRQAIDLSMRCPRSMQAFAVGAIIVASDGTRLSSGYSRETDASVHAEECALAKLPTDEPRLKGATVYSTVEPCSQRRSRPRSCTELVLAAGVRRMAIAWREPQLFVDCVGVERLQQAGVSVIEIPELASAVRAANAHLFGIRI